MVCVGTTTFAQTAAVPIYRVDQEPTKQMEATDIISIVLKISYIIKILVADQLLK